MILQSCRKPRDLSSTPKSGTTQFPRAETSSDIQGEKMLLLASSSGRKGSARGGGVVGLRMCQNSPSGRIAVKAGSGVERR